MKLLNFKASNLFSLGEVDLNLDKRGLLLVTGHSNDEGGANGSGKSSLSSKGIVWTLYGATAYGDKADAVINRFADEDATCSGSVDVECSNGGKFRIIRSRRPNRLTVIDLATNADVSCKLEKDTQALVDKLLGRSRETFLQTDFFGQGKAANFLDLTPKAQTELLETILPFDELNKLAEITKAHLSKLKIVRASIERHVAEQGGKLMEAQRQERELSASIDSWERQRDGKIEALTKEVEQLEANDPVRARLEELKTLVVTLPTKQETETTIANIESEIIYLNSTKDEYSRALSEWLASKPPVPHRPQNRTCPTCSQAVSHEKSRELLDKYNQDMCKIDEAEHQIRQISSFLEDLNYRQVSARGRQSDVERNFSYLKQVDLEIAQLETTRNSDKLAILRKNLEDVRLEVNPYEHLYDNNASTLKNVTLSLNHHKARLAGIDEDQKALEFWQGAFSKELKNEFLDQVCPFLQGKANIHLEGMGNVQLRVHVGTSKSLKTAADKSEFNIRVASSTGASDYAGLSGGE